MSGWGELELEGEPDLCTPGGYGRPQRRSVPCRRAHARGNQGVHGAQHVIGEQQADLVLGPPERVVAALDVVAEDLMLEGMIAPAPEKVGSDRAGLVELQRPPILQR